MKNAHYPCVQAVAARSFGARFRSTALSLLIVLFSIAVSAQPVVSSLSTYSGIPGSSVTISGSGFNSTAANNIVFFGTTRGTVTAASSTSLTVTVPTGASYSPLSVANTATSLTGYSKRAFVPTFSTGGYTPAISMGSHVDYVPSTLVSASVMKIGDMDGDGKPDIVIGSQSGSFASDIQIFGNAAAPGAISSSSFPTSVQLTGINYVSDMILADLDADGKLDIIAIVPDSVFIVRNTSSSGSISFASPVGFAVPAPFGGVNLLTAADLDMDGKIDLVCGTADVFGILHNVGSGGITGTTFESITIPHSPGYGYYSVADIDGDGKPDLVVGISENIAIMRNVSTPGTIDAASFAAEVLFTSPTGDVGPIKTGDFDGDGKTDVCILTSGYITVFKNLASSGTINTSSLQTAVMLSYPPSSFSLELADMNGDAKPDIVVSDAGTGLDFNITVLPNVTTSGSFTTSSFGAPQHFYCGTTTNYPSSESSLFYSMAIADINGDGRPDVAGPHGGQSFTVIQGQAPPPVITAPSAASGNPGTSIVLTGSNFNTTAANNKAWFGTVAGTVTSATATSVAVTVPYGATYGSIAITNTATAERATTRNSFIPTFDHSAYTAGSINFDTHLDMPVNLYGTAVTVCDLDGDGKPDLLASDGPNNTIFVYRNISSTGGITASSFASPVAFSTESGVVKISTCDIDGDGKPDIIAGLQPYGFSVLRNTCTAGTISTSSFAPQVFFELNTGDVTVGDLDGDGKPDVITSGDPYSSFYGYWARRNTSTPGVIDATSFDEQRNIQNYTSGSQMRLGDFNGDGRLDIASSVPYYGSGQTVIYKNTGTSGFISEIEYTFGSTTRRSFDSGFSIFSSDDWAYDVAVADFDGDGKADLAVTGPNTISVYRNISGSGSISFASPVSFAVKPTPDATPTLGIGDVDGDGKPDMIVGNGLDSFVSVFRNTASPGSITTASFAARLDFNATLGTTFPTVVDLDGDGKPEIVTGSVNGGALCILTNHPTSTSTATITGTLTVCAAGTTTLSSSTSGGTWSSSNAAIAVVGSASGIVTALAAGTSTITYTYSGGAATAVVTVAAGSLLTLSGTNHMEQGTYVSLFPNTLGGSWTSSNSGIATVDRGVVQGITAGTAAISYSTATCPAAVSMVVTVSAATSICATWEQLGASFTTPGLAFAINQAGTPYVLYRDGSNKAAVKKYNGSTWVSVGVSGFSAGTIDAGDIKIARDGTPYVTYPDQANSQKITVMKYDGSSWVGVGTAGFSAGAVVGPQLAIDSEGTVYAAYIDIGFVGVGAMKVKKYTGSAWVLITTNGLTASTVGDFSMVLAPNGIPYVAYSDSMTHKANVVKYNSGSWVAVGAANFSASTASYTNMTIDRNGVLYVDYNDGADSQRITVKKFNGSSWITIGSGFSSGTDSYGLPAPIITDANGMVYVAWGGEPYVQPAIVKRYNGTTWTSMGYGVQSVVPQLAVDGDGTVYLQGTSYVARLEKRTAFPGITSQPYACENSYLYPTHPISFGLWESGNTSVIDKNPPFSDYTMKTFAAGTATISYVQGTCVATQTVTVSVPAVVSPLLSEICAGSTLTMSASLAGGSWDAYPTSVATIDATSGIVTGVGSGSATIIYYSPLAYCPSTAYVTVNPIASAGTLSGPSSVAPGASVTVSSTVSGGTWSASNGNATVGSSSGIVTGVTAGTVVVSYSVTNSCGTAVATKIMTIGAAVAGITGTLSLCTGATTTLGDATAGGTWSSSNTAVATISATGVVTGVTSGMATITYSTSGGNATAVVTVNPLPNAGTITGVSGVVTGSSITLTASASGGTWSASNGNATVSGGVVTGVSAGSVTISYSVTNSCGTAVATKVITVGASVAGITGTLSLCAGTTTTLSDATAGGTWTSSNTAVATISATGVVAGVASGMATITYSTSGGNATAVVTVNPLPNAGTITGVSSVVTGSSITLSASVSGGTWSASNGNATVSGGVVTGVSVGSVIISYSVTNSCGTAVATKLVTIGTAVGGITGTLSLCAGATTTLSDATAGGTWSSGNTAVATIATDGVVTGVTPGMATITYATSGSYATAVVTVNALPAPITGATAVCEGGTTNLSSSTLGGTWSSSDMTVATVGTSGVVSGLVPGSADIAYATAAGCVRIATVTVNSNPIISGSATVCPGGTTLLTSSIAGGAWTGGTAAIATIGTTGLVTGVGTGTANITYSLGTGCKAMITVTVGPAPATITGTMKACPGTSTALSNTTAGGSWSTSDVTIATADATTGAITGVAAGTVTVTYTTGAGCYRTATVTINPAPAAIAGAAVICAGSSVTLTDVTPGLSWTSGNTAVATIGAGTGVVTGVSTGFATITYTAASTNCIATAIMTVNGIPAAIAGPATGCTGSNITLTNSVPGGAWSSSNTATATVDATTGVVTGVASGIVTITYTTGAGCYKTKAITINNSPTVSGYPTVCIGLTTTLSGGGSGTWSSGNPSVATVVTSGGYVTGVAAGTAVMTFTSGTTTCATGYTVTVMPVPAAITGTTTACTGTIVTLGNTTPGGSWSSSNTAGATVGSTTGIVNAVGTGGTVTISYSFGTNCRVTTPFTLKPLPAVIAGSPSVCMPVTTTLTTTTSGGTWTSSNTSVATIGTAISASYGLVTGVSSGTSNITYTITATGCARSTVISVDAGLNPGTITSSGGFTLHTVSAPTSVTLSSTGAAGGTWSSSNTAVATVNPATGVVTAVAAGSTTITYAVTANCTNIVTRVVNVVASRPGGSGQSGVGSVQLYPNPTSGAFTLVSDEAGTLHLFSIDGKEITNYSIGAGINSLSLPAELAAGVYMCRYTSESGNTTMVRLVYEK